MAIALTHGFANANALFGGMRGNGSKMLPLCGVLVVAMTDADTPIAQSISSLFLPFPNSELRIPNSEFKMLPFPNSEFRIPNSYTQSFARSTAFFHRLKFSWAAAAPAPGSKTRSILRLPTKVS